MTYPLYVTSPRLEQEKGVRHAFFTRSGGVSTGVYDSLNGGIGSKDQPEAVIENRRRMAASLGVSEDAFMLPYQVHSASAQIISKPFSLHDRPQCDALITSTPHLSIGVTGADCGILLIYDPRTRQIGATHAGWKGAIGGVLEASVAAFVAHGSRLEDLITVLGPTIAQESYEVGPEFVEMLTHTDATYSQFLKPSHKPMHALFDLPGLIIHRLKQAGVGTIEDLQIDTYTNESQFFSYRRATHRNEPDYGRQIAAIVLCDE